MEGKHLGHGAHSRSRVADWTPLSRAAQLLDPSRVLRALTLATKSTVLLRAEQVARFFPREHQAALRQFCPSKQKGLLMGKRKCQVLTS